MSDNDPLTPIDVKAPTLEKAIHDGLEQLGLSRNDVIIEIVEEGSRGVLGMGARDAVVRLTPLRPPTRRTEPQAPPILPGPVDEEPEVTLPPEPVQEDAAPVPPQAPATSPVPPADIAPSTQTPTQGAPEPEAAPQSAEPERTPEPEAEPAPPVRPPAATDEDMEREARIAREALLELLEHMGVEADIDVYHAEPAPSEDEAPWILDVRGNDLGILIGRHGDTLNALQYITRLIVSRELQRRANIVVDVEGYKARREESLHKLAERMAQKAVQSGRTVTLDPMPPNERRVIHVALRGDSRVETESIGSGDSRRVTIIPSNNKGNGDR